MIGKCGAIMEIVIIFVKYMQYWYVYYCKKNKSSEFNPGFQFYPQQCFANLYWSDGFNIFV